MSLFASDLGDAVRPDGTLKDVSEIVWSYDADESIPFPSGDSGTLPVLSGGPASATLVAAVRRTTCISRPCWHFLEAAEEELASSVPARKSSGVKRKAASNLPDHSATHKKVINMAIDNAGDDIINMVIDNAGNDASDGRTPSLPPTEPMSNDYEDLRAMADTDDQVRPP
jgi:hypothetical protein